MNGRLFLRVGLENGRSALCEARCEFPLQVLGPQRECADGWLRLVVLTPSGGLLDGDDLQAEIVIERDAKLELCTQAATQLHRGRSSQSWSFRLDDGAALSYIPRTLVPHAGVTHHTRLSVAMTGSGQLLLTEAVAPGRVHHGELFAYDELRSDLDIWRDGSLVARERQLVRPLGTRLQTQIGPYCHFASVYAFGVDAARLDAASTSISAAVELGVSELAFGGACVRLLGQRAFDVEEALAAIHECWRRDCASRDSGRPTLTLPVERHARST